MVRRRLRGFLIGKSHVHQTLRKTNTILKEKNNNKFKRRKKVIFPKCGTLSNIYSVAFSID